jgi:hypothetical protein
VFLVPVPERVGNFLFGAQSVRRLVYGSDGGGFRVRIPTEARDILISVTSRPSVGPPILHIVATGGLSPGGKTAGT